MPVTPLHLGPGAVMKAALGRNMSLTVFAFCQFTMDLEVGVRMLLGAQQLHGFSNTLLGASVILLPSVWLGRPISQTFLGWWNARLTPSQARWLRVDAVVTWKAAWLGGLLGIYSHWLLDAVMHLDARPWAPFSSVNPFLGLLSYGALNVLCLSTLLLGAVVLGIRRYLA